MAFRRKVRPAITATRVAIDMGGHAACEAFAEELLATARYSDAHKLNRYELQMFSQNGEDGILAEIFRRIGTTDPYFVEFGVENGLETNTTYRLRAGWRGVWYDGDAKAIAAARCLRNTYHVWDALAEYRPRVAVIEYNASVPVCHDWVIPYDANRTWGYNVLYGASLKAYQRLGRERGYSLVGCNLAGVNAFFVRDDLVGDQFAAPFTSEHHFEPPRYWLRWRAGHPRGVEV